MNSSRKRIDQILGVISTKRAESLVLDWANLQNLAYSDSAKASQRMYSRYPEVFSGFESQGDTLGLLIVIRNYLRQAWDAPDARHREWVLFKLRDTFQWQSVMQTPHAKSLWEQQINSTTEKHRITAAFELSSAFEAVPEITAFEASIFHLTRISDRARHCQNPTCPAPYFLAGKKGQKYCSEACAEPAQREAKRRWWNEKRAKNGGIQ